VPLAVDYMEKTSAAGEIPGGYGKGEAWLTATDVLTSRIIDRPLR
jgi:polyribonucleotide nucleotidyltransferase